MPPLARHTFALNSPYLPGGTATWRLPVHRHFARHLGCGQRRWRTVRYARRNARYLALPLPWTASYTNGDRLPRFML